VLLVLSLLGGACTDGPPAENSQKSHGPDESAEKCGRFVVFERDDWTFKEAVDYPRDIGDWPQPHLDWYAEFERFIQVSADTQRGERLTIAGFTAGLDLIREQLPPGVQLEDKGGVLAASGMEPPDALIAKPVRQDYTLTFSGDVGEEELTQVSDQARSVCEKEWLEAGGKVLDCMPTEPGCISEF